MAFLLALLGTSVLLCTGKQDGSSQWRRLHFQNVLFELIPHQLSPPCCPLHAKPNNKANILICCGNVFVLKISVPIPSLNQDLNTQRSGFSTRCVPPGSVSDAESTVKEAYSRPLLMRLCTLLDPRQEQ